MLFVCISIFSTAVFPAFASTIPSFEAWQAELRAEALSKGISPDVFDTAFVGLQPIKRVIELDRSQPEFTMTLDTYLSKVVSNSRIKNARQKLTEHKKVLDGVSKKFGVQSRFGPNSTVELEAVFRKNFGVAYCLLHYCYFCSSGSNA